MVDASYIIISVGRLVGRLKRKEMIHMSRRPKSKVINNPMYILQYEEGVSWGRVDVPLGVCDTLEKAEELLNHVIENKVLEDYANFEFIKLQKCGGEAHTKDYVAIYEGDHREIECWFKIVAVELNALCYSNVD